METQAAGTYPPINTLKRVADGVWIVDGPIIRFGTRWLKMPFPTRMTIIRIEGDLFVHSPTELTPTLKDEVERIGQPRWIVGPNRIHHWWIPDWHAAFPDARVYLAPRIKEQAAGRIDFDSLPLNRASGYPWDSEIATQVITGSYMAEAEFFHYASRTLVLTDFIENFEPQKLNFAMRWLTRFGGVQHPNGAMPRDMRLTFPRPLLKEAVETMIGWNPKRIIVAHGRCYETNGTDELRRAFQWLLQ